MPVISFMRVRQDRKVSEFHGWLLAQIATTFENKPASQEASQKYCIVSLGESSPSGLSLPPAMRLDASNSVPWPPYDAAVLRGDFEPAAVVPAGLDEWIDLNHAYRVTRNVIKDDGVIVDGRPSTGIKYLRGLIFHQDLPESAVRRSWARHAPLAVEVHVGASRYVQWWVDEHLSRDAPKIGGIAERHFATGQALAERFFDSPRGMKEIVQDTGHFIAGGPPRLFARDHVFGKHAD
jgi:hypothetical protein